MTGRWWIATLFLFAPAAAAAQSFQKDQLRPLAELVRLPDGDSARLIAAGPTDLRSGPTGLMIVFDPFLPLSDSLTIRRKSFALFRALLPRVGSARPFVLLRAQDGSATDSRLDQIIEWHDDDKWYAPGGVIERVE